MSSTRANLSWELTGFQPLRFARETRTPDLPTGNLFRHVSTWQRQRFFVVESHVRLFLKTLYGYRRAGRFQLHAFVVPDHIHLLHPRRRHNT